MDTITTMDACQYKHIEKLQGTTKSKMLELPSTLHARLDEALTADYNPSLCGVARLLKENQFTEAEAVEVIYTIEGHRTPVGEEIEDAVSTVYSTKGTARKVKWKQPAKVTTEAILANLEQRNIGLISEDELADKIGRTAACDDLGDFLKRFYKGIEFVYIGSQYTGTIASVDHFVKHADEIHKKGHTQLVCNPMKRPLSQQELSEKAYDDSGNPVLTKGGRHKLKYGNGGRCYEFASDTLDVVTFECDNSELLDRQFAIIAYLAQYLPLVAVVFSGGKSYHATFSLKGVPKKHLEELRQTMVNLGADRSVPNPVHLTRLGCVQREGKGLQRVLYLNEDARAQSVTKEKLAEFLAPPQAEALTEVHRNSTDGKYWMQNTHTENWHAVNMQEMNADLKAAGFSGDQATESISRGRHEGSVDGVLQLAGRTRGVFKSLKGDFLVPRKKYQIQPRKGEWPVTKALFKGMFHGEDYNVTQYDVFMSWLARAWRSYTTEEILVAQFLHIAGAAGSYKTYLVEYVLPNLFGQLAELNKHLVSDQQFNSDLFKGFLQVADDPDMPRNGKVNHELIKSIAVSSETCRCEGKNINSENTPALRRGILLTNTGTEAMKVVPVFEDGMNDKIICLYVHKFRLEVPGYDLPTEKSLVDAWRREAPALAYELENYEPPEWGDENYADRYGVPSYKNPLVLKALREMSSADDHHLNIMKVVWRDYDTNHTNERFLTAAELLAAGSAALADGVITFFGWGSTRSLGKVISHLEPLSDVIHRKGKGSNTTRWIFTRPERSPFIGHEEEPDLF